VLEEAWAQLLVCGAPGCARLFDMLYVESFLVHGLVQARLLALVVWPPSGNLHQPNFGACHCREEQHSYREAPILRMELVHRARTCSGMAGSLEGEWVGRDEDGNIAGGFQAIT